jgi:hypothetical protein
VVYDGLYLILYINLVQLLRGQRAQLQCGISEKLSIKFIINNTLEEDSFASFLEFM